MIEAVHNKGLRSLQQSQIVKRTSLTAEAEEQAMSIFRTKAAGHYVFSIIGSCLGCDCGFEVSETMRCFYLLLQRTMADRRRINKSWSATRKELKALAYTTWLSTSFEVEALRMEPGHRRRSPPSVFSTWQAVHRLRQTLSLAMRTARLPYSATNGTFRRNESIPWLQFMHCSVYIYIYWLR